MYTDGDPPAPGTSEAVVRDARHDLAWMQVLNAPIVLLFFSMDGCRCDRRRCGANQPSKSSYAATRLTTRPVSYSCMYMTTRSYHCRDARRIAESTLLIVADHTCSRCRRLPSPARCCAAEARQFCSDRNATFVHPFDDPSIIEGQVRERLHRSWLWHVFARLWAIATRHQ